MNDMEKQQKIQKLDNWSISKGELCSEWIDTEVEDRNRSFHQGEVVMCELGENIGYEICNWRPALIVSDTRYSQQGQIVVIPLTKNTRLQRTHYNLFKKNYDFLTYDSCVKTEQIRSISAIRVKKIIGKITSQDMNRIKNRLKTLINI